MNLESLSHRYRDAVVAELRDIVGESDLALYGMMRYHLGWESVTQDAKAPEGGKFLRPSLCLLACESVGGEWKPAVSAAASLELLHNFTLIHDDIEDDSEERRGRRTVWHIWGRPQAINAGDAMHTLARLAVLRLHKTSIEKQKVIDAAGLLDATCLKLCEGQFLDMSYEEQLDIGTEDYLKMISLKTAQLFDCSLRMGALLGTADERLIEHLGRFGYHLGMAFQIRDDLLGIWGKRDITGKPSVDDIRKRKKTLPVIYGLGNTNRSFSRELRRVYGKPIIDEQDVTAVLNILDELGAKEYTGGVAEEYCRKALAELESVKIRASCYEDLKSIALFAMKRDY